MVYVYVYIFVVFIKSFFVNFLYLSQEGNGVVRGNYISVFLELSVGLPETSK